MPRRRQEVRLRLEYTIDREDVGVDKIKQAEVMRLRMMMIMLRSMAPSNACCAVTAGKACVRVGGPFHHLA